ncbi:VOC family protein [Pontibaca methylaminivorans]|uniref:Glyoxalase/Bleomycin resistance protein/Dioxygenase superfamily protein n=1 Tax=Pontibaca methylaminivorans TaxID=515897 RepID=A0A1R3WBI7_9RHOB|nr:VOC family protein [Pontibaca methylaminivorans]SIT75180.1 Glyoxalase/Bleomycin resistance protein/Dioxygenase superfamily protein [Pontibaca methylaminivorans]
MTHLPDAPAPSAVLESAVYAEDLEAARRFYGDLIGLEPFQTVEGRHIFFRVGAAVLLVFNPEATKLPSRNPRLPVPTHGATGPGHVCFVLDREQIAAMRARLVAAGIGIDAEFDWPHGARSLYVRDPAGNSVEFAESWLWEPQ